MCKEKVCVCYDNLSAFSRDVARVLTLGQVVRGPHPLSFLSPPSPFFFFSSTRFPLRREEIPKFRYRVPAELTALHMGYPIFIAYCAVSSPAPSCSMVHDGYSLPQKHFQSILNPGNVPVATMLALFVKLGLK